ncbi:MAG: HEAT repeat domain-containing protein [Elainellaceae cyanobacterium]
MTDPIAQLCQLITEMLRDNPAMSQADLVSAVEGAIDSNPELAAALKTDNRMQQINRNGAKGFQTLAKDSSRVFIEGTHYHLSDPEKLKAVLESVLQKLQPTEPKAIDFQAYLQSILDDEDYREWQEVYTPTIVEGKKQPPKPKYSPRLKLRVEMVKPKEEEKKEENQREQVEQWEALAGLRQYAPDHVLLIGKPGSGKSTSLERLLWEDASHALNSQHAKIPVLVKLRRCTSTIEGLIQDFFSRHQLSLTIVDIEYLLSQGKLLLLLDGLNELPEAFRITITNFRDKYRTTTPMIVSTRDLGVGGTLDIKKTLKMLPLTEPQMKEFVRGYLEEEGDRLFQQLKGDRLRKFAETPLLLWMLCRVFAQNGQVPSNLGLAFREFTQLYDRQIQEDAPADSRYQWPKLLRHLSFALMHDKEAVEFRLSMSREEAENLLTEYLQQEGRTNARACAERWLQDLLDYHLIQPVIQPNYEEHIEFRHQLIQEYYAAEYLRRRLPELSNEQLKRDYLNLLKWTEPIALMLALLDEEEQALRVVRLALVEVDLMLGARLAGKVKSEFQHAAICRIKQAVAQEDIQVICFGKTLSQVAVPAIIKFLSHQDSWVRARAVDALADIESERAVLHLIEVLGDPNGHVREFVHKKLQEVSDSTSIPILLKVIGSQDSDIRWRVTSVLESVLWKEKVNNRKLIPVLLELLNDFDSSVRSSAVRALWSMKDKSIIPKLLEIIDQDPDFDVRYVAASALGEIGDIKTLLKLVGTFSYDKWLEEPVGDALRRVCDESETLELIEYLNDSDPYVRSGAAEAIGAIGDEKAIPELLNILNHPDSEVRYGIVKALGNTLDKNVVPELLNVLHEDEDFDVCINAVEALGKIADESAIPGLLDALRYGSDYLSYCVVKSLGRIGDESAISEVFSKLGSEDLASRLRVAELLGEIGGKGATKALLEALKDRHSVIRMRAVESLGKISDKSVRPALIRVLSDPDSSVRESAKQALNKICNRSKFSSSSKYLESVKRNISKNRNISENHEVMSKKLELISEDIISELHSTILFNEDPDARRQAVCALWNVGNESAILALLEALSDPSPLVCSYAAITLERMASLSVLSRLWYLALKGNAALFNTISVIQDRYRFYNYTIAHGIISQGKTISLYFSYAPADETLQTQLANHLTLLERQGIITSWSQRQILPGDDRTQVINQQLNTADIILLLISANSLADDTCYHLEIQRAMERHQANEAHVIPILLRPVAWIGASFSSLTVLPVNHQPITLWDNQDEAFQEIAKGIRAVAMKVREEKERDSPS